MRIYVVILLLALVTSPSVDAYPRSQKAKHDFAATHVCPATGKHTMSCKGYVIDHIIPLCAGGADAPINMQWQALSISLQKDARERRYCACLRSKPKLQCTL